MIQENEVGLTYFRNEWQKAGFSLLYTYGFLINSYESFFKKQGLTNQQYYALRILRDKFPKPVSTAFLREKMLDKMSDVSRLVSRLEAKGLVNVSKNSVDKRLVNILISEQGQHLVGAIDKDLPQLDAIMQDLTEQEASTLVTLLYKVRETIKTGEKATAD